MVGSVAAVSTSAFASFDMNRRLLEKEEWYLAVRGLNRAMQFETPSEILRSLVRIVKLISHAVDALMNRYD